MNASKESLQLILDCCIGSWRYSTDSRLPKANRWLLRRLEFIHLISSESNDVCEKESKKTISPEHVITALKARLLSPELKDTTLTPCYRTL